MWGFRKARNKVRGKRLLTNIFNLLNRHRTRKNFKKKSLFWTICRLRWKIISILLQYQILKLSVKYSLRHKAVKTQFSLGFATAMNTWRYIRDLKLLQTMHEFGFDNYCVESVCAMFSATVDHVANDGTIHRLPLFFFSSLYKLQPYKMVFFWVFNSKNGL